MNVRDVESYGEFAKERIDAITDALCNGNSKEALRLLESAATYLEAMRKEIGPVGY